jgi:hypothetical protein
MKAALCTMTVVGMLVALASGCATVTKGASQSVTLDTKPPGATCVITRKGEKIAAVNPTPGTVSVSKSKDALSVSCTKEGYLEAAGSVESEFQAMTFGNILLGGIIGVAVDAASGAINNYKPSITITLIPERFPSEAERDTFFDGLRSELQAESAEVEERIKKVCNGKQQCDNQLKAAGLAKEAKLLEIEKKRTLAKVDPIVSSDTRN